MSKTNRAEVEEERRRKFYILRYKIMLEEKGIDKFDAADLKKMLDLKVITRAAYKRQLRVLNGELQPIKLPDAAKGQSNVKVASLFNRPKTNMDSVSPSNKLDPHLPKTSQFKNRT